MLKTPIAAPLFAVFLAATLVVAAQPKTGAQFYAEDRVAFATRPRGSTRSRR